MITHVRLSSVYVPRKNKIREIREICVGLKNKTSFKNTGMAFTLTKERGRCIVWLTIK